MTSFYEKRGNNFPAMGDSGQGGSSITPEGYGLGVSGPRLEGGWPTAPSSSGMFPIGQAADTASKFQMPQYALTPPSGGNADVAGIQQAMERFKKMGVDQTESKLRNLASKHAAQDNSLDSRSATGEGKGLSYKTNDDDHATGTAAWDSLGQYMKTANEANVSAYIEGGMNERSAIKKAYPDWSDAQIDAFLSSYNKRAADLEKEAALISGTVAGGLALGARALPWLVRAGSKVLPWAARGLGWGAKGGKTIAKGVSKVPSVYRAAGGGVKGVAAGGKKLSRSLLGRAPGGAGRYARGTGVRGLVGRHPMESMLTVGTLGMGGFGGGGGGAPQAQGGPGGGGYGPGIRRWGTFAGQQDQWNPDWEQTTQPVGHTPKEASMNIKAACDATGLTPYQLTFALRVHEADLSPQQIKEGIEKAGEYMGEEYVEELREGMDKIASMDKEALAAVLRPLLAAGLKAAPKGGLLLKGLKGMKGVVPGGAKALPTYTSRSSISPMGGMLPKGMSISTPGAARVGGGKLGEGSVMARLSDKLFKSPAHTPITSLGRFGGKGGLLRMAGGAYTGNVAAGEDAPWYVKYPMMAGGAAFGRAMPHMGAPARAAGGRALTGGFMGMAGDEVAGMAGIDTGGRLSQLGALGGFASPLARGQGVPGAKGLGSLMNTQGLPTSVRKAGIGLRNAKLPDLSPGGAISRGGAATAAKYLGKPGTTRNFATQAGLYSSPALAGAGIAGVGGAIDSKVEAARQKSMQEVMNDPKIQNALEMAEQGGGFMKSISGIANVIDPILEMIGIDPSQMNPLMKIMLMAGGGLGIGGLLSGSKGAGIGGLATMAVPLIAQYMKQHKAPRTPSGELIGPGLTGSIEREQGRFSDAERTAFEQLPQSQQDQFNALPQQQQQQLLEDYRSGQTELEKATG